MDAASGELEITVHRGFDATFVQQANDNKLLMVIMPVWAALGVFGGTPDSSYYKTAEHQLGVAARP